MVDNYTFEISGISCCCYGDFGSSYLLIQPVDDHDLGLLSKEYQFISSAVNKPFLLTGFLVKDWLTDLTPWPAPPAFGKRNFGDGARITLNFIEDKLVPTLLSKSSSCSPSLLHTQHSDGCASPVAEIAKNNTQQVDVNTSLNSDADSEEEQPLGGKISLLDLKGDNDSKAKDVKIFLGGYSLAGLFALWSGYQTRLFDGIVAASPSVWYPKWIEYASNFKPQAPFIYLSMGDKEGKTRNRMMSSVDKNMRRQKALFYCQGVDSEMEWNQGGHFQDTAKRTAQGFARCMLHYTKS